MKPIGGYFELELPQRSEYHSTAIALNMGRNALEFILRVRGYRHVYLPYYSCEVLLEPFSKLGIDYTFYHIDEHLEIETPITLGNGEALLCINYYGLKHDYIKALVARYGKQLIVDNTQAFFAPPFDGVDTFYSCRKFFGVADGAYLYCDQPLNIELHQDQSWQRMDYLLKRADISAEVAYADFRAQSAKLKDNPIKRMSHLTHRIMASINYKQVATIRRENFRLLDEALKEKNHISLPLTDDTVPMVYPFLSDDDGLRQRLIENKIFVAQYWPNVLDWCEEGNTDYQLTKKLLPLPIDQRYGTEEMFIICKLINT